MTFREWLRGLWPRRREAPIPPTAPPLEAQSAPAVPAPGIVSRASTQSTSSNPRPIPTGRASVDTPNTIISDTWIVVPPDDYESAWRTLNLDANNLDALSPKELLDMLADLSPEVSRALWDFLRLCNPGYTCKAYKPGGEKAEDANGQAALDAFLATLRDLYGSPDVVFGRLFTGAFMRGAFCSELVLDPNGRLPVDLATPDPYSVRFRKRKDNVRGEIWQPGQWQQANFVPLDIPTFKYLPVDPMPGVPYGRPLAAPALFTAIFLLGLLHDIKRVVMQQGYMRMDISVDSEKAKTSYSFDNAGYATFTDYVNAGIAAIKAIYKALEPDDAFIHSDIFVLNKPAGTVGMDSIGAIDKIVDKLESGITRALKSNSLLMGTDSSATETDSNRRWEIHAAGIKSLQHYCEAMLESHLTLTLEAQGIQAVVEFRFAELRAAEELRDAQTDAMKTANARAKYEAGYYSQDEASNEAVGKDADAPEPRGGVGAPPPPQLQQDNGDGQQAGSGVAAGRSKPQGYGGIISPAASPHGAAGGGKEERVKIIPDGANEPLLPVPDEVTISDSDTDRAVADWDELMPDYAGLLNATVIGQTQFDRGQTRAAGDASPWTWDQNNKRYRSTETGRYVGPRQMTELRDEFIQAKSDVAQSLANDLANGKASLQEMEVAFRREIKTVFVDQYVMAKGGRNAMTQADWGAVGQMVREQYAFAHDFARDIADGKLSEAQIANRVQSYFNSSTQAFERGHTASYGVPTLPEYPADGSQTCRSNCRCSWGIEETDDAWNCTWMTSAGESCPTCTDNAKKWAPLIVMKAGRGRDDLEKILEGVRTNGYH